MNIALTGGGTAGHIMPNIALLDELRKKSNKIIYIGNSHNMEKIICESYKVKFFHTDCIKLDRTKFFANIAIPFVLPHCVKQAKHILTQQKIDIVFSKGGWVSLPTTLAARRLGIPVVCHESDATLGVANKLTSKYAQAVITSHKGTFISPKTYMLGNPLREQIFHGDEQAVFSQLHIDHSRPILLVVGGSLGALAINQTLAQSLDKLCQTYNIIHITGKSFTPPVHDGYFAMPYADNIQDFIQVADVVVSRCGANFAQELLALGKKTLFIPLPTKASRGDQITNANEYERLGYCRTLQQKDMTADTLVQAIDDTYHSHFKTYHYDRDTPSKIVTLLYRLAKNYT